MLYKITRTWLTAVLFLGLLSPTFSQNVVRDTSYTVKNTEQKLKKDYPFIEPVLVSPAAKVKREVVYYAQYGNRSLQMEVYIPQKKQSRAIPGVLLIHGGGWRSGSPELMLPLALALADSGYVTAIIEYRLSPEAHYPAAVVDAKKAVQFLKAHATRYHLDTTRIAALGCSAGAQLASLLGATNGTSLFLETTSPSPDVQAVINIDGLMAFDHPESEEYGRPGTLSSAARWFGATFEENPEPWWEASALTHLDKTMPPILFIGSSFPRFQAGRDDAVKKLDSLDIYSEVHLLPNSPHSFWLFHPWFEPTLHLVHTFLERTF